MQQICFNCNKEVELDSKTRFCQWCGWDMQRIKENSSDKFILSTPDFLKYSQYYQDTFKLFDQNGGRFVPTWNWASFFNGIIWYFVKRMPVKSILILVVIFASGWVLAIPVWIYMGMVGNYDYYLSEIKKKRLW